MLSWKPLYLLDEVGLTIGNGMSFASCLPSLVSVAVSVCFSMQDANALLRLPSLEYAIFRIRIRSSESLICIQDAGALRSVGAWRQLLVGMSSKLQVLLLEGQTRILTQTWCLTGWSPAGT